MHFWFYYLEVVWHGEESDIVLLRTERVKDRKMKLVCSFAFDVIPKDVVQRVYDKTSDVRMSKKSCPWHYTNTM